jgi:hypothetical protein
MAMERSAGALRLVVNIIVIWNTLSHRCGSGTASDPGFYIKMDHVALLSPLVFDHLNPLRGVSFSLPDTVQHGQLRPLRNSSQAAKDAA